MTPGLESVSDGSTLLLKVLLCRISPFTEIFDRVLKSFGLETIKSAIGEDIE